jgi:excisionase family DNA binding protein
MQHTKEELKAKLALITRLLSNQHRGWALKEASELLGKSESTLYREIKAGKLTTYKLGGSTRISHKELIRYNKGNDPAREMLCQLQLLISITEQLASPTPNLLDAIARTDGPFNLQQL